MRWRKLSKKLNHISLLDLHRQPYKRARDSWCLRKHIHWEGKNVVNYFIARRRLLLGHLTLEIALEAKSSLVRSQLNESVLSLVEDLFILKPFIHDHGWVYIDAMNPKPSGRARMTSMCMYLCMYVLILPNRKRIHKEPNCEGLYKCWKNLSFDPNWCRRSDWAMHNKAPNATKGHH